MRHRHRSPERGSLLPLALVLLLHSRAQRQANGKAVTQSALVAGCRALPGTLEGAKSEQHANRRNGHHPQPQQTLYTRGFREGRQGRRRSVFGRFGPRLGPWAGTQRPGRGQLRKNTKSIRRRTFWTWPLPRSPTQALQEHCKTCSDNASPSSSLPFFPQTIQRDNLRAAPENKIPGVNARCNINLAATRPVGSNRRTRRPLMSWPARSCLSQSSGP